MEILDLHGAEAVALLDSGHEKEEQAAEPAISEPS